MPVFEETQTLNPVYSILILAFVIAMARWLWSYFDLRNNKQLSVIIGVGLFVITMPILLFSFERLHTTIDETGIHYKYFPGSVFTTDIKWSEINFVGIRQFKPWFMETTRTGMGRKDHDTQFVISGTTGLLISLNDRPEIILGTQRSADLMAVLQRLVSDNVIDKHQINL